MALKKKFRDEMMARTTSIITQNLVEITWHVGVRGWSVMFFTFLFLLFFFENNAVGRRPLWCIVELLLQDIASAFVGRFRCGLQRYFAKKALSSLWKQFSKLSLGGATISARMAEKNENLRKWVQRLCAPLRLFISVVKEKYYHSILPHVL